MTTPKPTHHEPNVEEAWRQQCMLYLLGELNDVEATAFEQQLHSSPQLGEALLGQANVIASLSTSTLPCTVPAATLPCTSPCRTRYHRVSLAARRFADGPCRLHHDDRARHATRQS